MADVCVRCVCLVVILLLAPELAGAQESRSAALASELTELLEAQSLDSVAAKGAADDQFVGALYFPGSQLLVVSAAYSVPQRMEQQLALKNYRDVYIDLNSASIPESKVFISDLGANGLQARREENQPFDTADVGGRSYSFDGDWGRSFLTEAEYLKVFEDTEQQYIMMLEALVAELKKPS